MVYIHIDTLPPQIKQQLKYTEQLNDPSNYIPFQQLKQLITDYNNDHVESDYLYLHQLVAMKFIYESDLEVIKQQWDNDHRPAEVLKEIQARELRSQDRKFIEKSNSISKGAFYVKPNDSFKDYERSMSFAFSFVFSIFASALLGYYFGLYFLQLPQDQCYVLAILFLMGALLVETGLYIIKIMKDERIKKMKPTQGIKTSGKQKVD